MPPFLPLLPDLPLLLPPLFLLLPVLGPDGIDTDTSVSSIFSNVNDCYCCLALNSALISAEGIKSNNPDINGEKCDEFDLVYTDTLVHDFAVHLVVMNHFLNHLQMV